MTADAKILIHELLCLVLLYSVFCRAVRSSESVRLDVRAAFFGLGVIACIGLAAPVAWGFIPDAFELALLTSIAIVQTVTARHWVHGVPDRFCKPSLVPHRRRAGDKQGGAHDHA